MGKKSSKKSKKSSATSSVPSTLLEGVDKNNYEPIAEELINGALGESTYEHTPIHAVTDTLDETIETKTISSHSDLLSFKNLPSENKKLSLPYTLDRIMINISDIDSFTEFYLQQTFLPELEWEHLRLLLPANATQQKISSQDAYYYDRISVNLPHQERSLYYAMGFAFLCKTNTLKLSEMPLAANQSMVTLSFSKHFDNELVVDPRLARSIFLLKYTHQKLEDIFSKIGDNSMMLEDKINLELRLLDSFNVIYNSDNYYHKFLQIPIIYLTNNHSIQTKLIIGLLNLCDVNAKLYTNGFTIEQSYFSKFLFINSELLINTFHEVNSILEAIIPLSHHINIYTSPSTLHITLDFLPEYAKRASTLLESSVPYFFTYQWDKAKQKLELSINNALLLYKDLEKKHLEAPDDNKSLSAFFSNLSNTIKMIVPCFSWKETDQKLWQTEIPYNELPLYYEVFYKLIMSKEEPLFLIIKDDNQKKAYLQLNKNVKEKSDDFLMGSLCFFLENFAESKIRALLDKCKFPIEDFSSNHHKDYNLYTALIKPNSHQKHCEAIKLTLDYFNISLSNFTEKPFSGRQKIININSESFAAIYQSLFKIVENLRNDSVLGPFCALNWSIAKFSMAKKLLITNSVNLPINAGLLQGKEQTLFSFADAPNQWSRALIIKDKIELSYPCFTPKESPLQNFKLFSF